MGQQSLSWLQQCTLGGLQFCASVELTLTPNGSGQTDVSVRMRNLQGTQGTIPWRLENLTFRNLKTSSAFPGSFFFPPQATLSGAAGIHVDIDPTLCGIINGGPCPGPNWGQTEWFSFNEAPGRGGFYWTIGSGAGPWMPSMIGCDAPMQPPSNGSLAWGSFQTCGDGWVGVSFTMPGNVMFDENSQVSWFAFSDQGDTSCVVGTNCAHVTPEPLTITLLGTGLLGIGAARRRRRQREDRPTCS